MESAICKPVPRGTQLIETFGWHPEGGYRRLDRHLARMRISAKALGFVFDDAKAQVCLDGLTTGQQALRCRLTLSVNGDFHLTSAPLGETHAVWRVGIAKARLRSDDIWLRYKTTQRVVYDQARAHLPSGVDELIFLNEAGEVCEGTITNIFVHLPSGNLVTPPVSCGLLPGILRKEMVLQGEAATEKLTLTDLCEAKQIWVGNSLRGLIQAELIA